MASSRRSAEPVTILIADDEHLAREAVRLAVESEPNVTRIIEASSGLEAVDLISQFRPEVIFLDIQMPGLDGFEVLRRLDIRHDPVVVFVTAHNEYALKAFEIHALDYVLKPFEDQRLRSALAWARTTVARSRTPGLQKLKTLLSELEDAPEGSSRATRLLVRGHRGHYYVRTKDIEWVEAAGNYVLVFAQGREHLIRSSMALLESQLDDESFARIHRSVIVNRDQVRFIRPQPSGDYTVTLESGKNVRMSRRYRERLLTTFS